MEAQLVKGFLFMVSLLSVYYFAHSLLGHIARLLQDAILVLKEKKRSRVRSAL